ncbi:hypothetical protein C8E87_8122 [Paractinoplanes brasiliensis]|uniref:Uncharacterized protein n=2 Tax=Paractinoplanes brasiliensis TaxID=52695 RepID=A0A4R6JAW4_9ACTN|nr:hypothetical protein C8E87_8122 [Actinoplanes brasiliensis]GID32784.1 hypothetical protein Abr02nite_77670 [Actinoplanes brasiliensis]
MMLLSAMLMRALVGLFSQPEPTVERRVAAEPVPADRVLALLPQFSAGVRGSRAPPVALA